MVALKAAASLARKAKELRKKFKGKELKEKLEDLYGGPKKTKTKPKIRKEDLTAKERTTVRSRKQKAKEYKAMPKAARREARALEKAQIKEELAELSAAAGGTRSLSLSKEGRKLADSDNLADQEKLLKSLRAKGERSPYIRHPLEGTRPAKGTKLSSEEIRELPPAEEIEYRLHRRGAPLTREQASRAMRGKEMPIDPEDIKTGFQEFKKGGMSRKKYQSTNKYNGKDYVYMGGGLVGDIMHFKKKRGR